MQTDDVADDDALLHGGPFAIVQAEFHQQPRAHGKGARYSHFQFQTGAGDIDHLDQAGILWASFPQEREFTRQISTLAVLFAFFEPAPEVVAAGTGAIDRDFLVGRRILAHIGGLGLATSGTAKGGGVVAGDEYSLVHGITTLFEALPGRPQAATGVL